MINFRMPEKAAENRLRCVLKRRIAPLFIIFAQLPGQLGSGLCRTGAGIAFDQHLFWSPPSLWPAMLYPAVAFHLLAHKQHKA
jgi:hypothetical protein